jgi:Trk K+ transport system NAD-binding subunit
MALETTAVARQLLSSDHVVTATDTNAAVALQQKKDVFYAVRAEML